MEFGFTPFPDHHQRPQPSQSMSAPVSVLNPKDYPAWLTSSNTCFFGRAVGTADNSFLAALSKIGGYAAAHTRHNYTEFFDVIPRSHLYDVLTLEGNRFLADPPGADAIHNQLKIINAEILKVTHSTPTGGFPWRQLPEIMYTH